MIPKLIGAVIAVGVIGYILAGLQRSLAASWFLVRIWRWLSGEAHHGHPITDAGWFRPGQRAMTKTGHATRWWHLPRWKRAAARTGGTLGAIAVIWAWLVQPTVTNWLLLAGAVAAAAWMTRRTVRRITSRKRQRTWLHPLHLAAHELAGHPRAIRAGDWITAELDGGGAVRKATLALPAGFPADEQDKKRLVAMASAKLGIEAAEPSWRLAGPAPQLVLEHSEPPPLRVALDDIAEAVGRARANDLVFGIGKKNGVVTASLAGDSPHIALSMGSGAGKSNLAAFLLMQELARGAIALVLDAKWISHPWLFGLPNVAYARTVAELHASMAWLAYELDRRNQVAFRSVDARGNIRANVGPRLFVVAEELNFAVPQLRSYWAEIRDSGDPARSPALTGLGATAFAGRQVKMHLVLIGQMLTAAATGSQDSSVKQNTGIIAMSRYTPKGWRAMAEEHPMPPAPQQTGRIQLVTASGVRETQVPLVDPEHARDFVLAGNVTPCPPGMPCAQLPVTPPPELENLSDLEPETVTPPPPVTAGPERVTLDQAVRLGLLHPATTKGALRMARFRDAAFPARVGARGSEYEYDTAALVAWDLARRS